jgi:hypothetical protein
LLLLWLLWLLLLLLLLLVALAAESLVFAGTAGDTILPTHQWLQNICVHLQTPKSQQQQQQQN